MNHHGHELFGMNAGGGMDHGGGGMDHGGGDHGGGSMMKCSMNMLWNTQIIDTCVVFPQWHIGSNLAFVVSFLIIVGLGIVYEWLRNFQRRIDISIAKSLYGPGPVGRMPVSDASPSAVGPSETDSLLTGHPKGRKIVQVPFGPRLVRAVLYGSTIFLSFFLMLVFMTYNAYLILAVVLGAAIGHFIFGRTIDLDSVLAESAGKTMACH